MTVANAASESFDQTIQISQNIQIDLYRRMVQLRQFEKRAYDLFLQGLVKGTSHLSLGQEAISAAFGEAMRSDDWTFATYRGHAHTLSRGVPMAPVMAELMGRADGLMAGKGGSMHLTSVEHGMMGSYAIVGAHLPIALGAAFSSKYRKSGQVAVCFFGDGTTNIGAFHEALNLAAIWKLPVVFVCENNLYMEYIISAIGLSPVIAAPITVPSIACSDIGVSNTLSGPNSSSNPVVALKTPPAAATSSPRKTTLSSRLISWAIASPTASR